jgi:hypothetical protein
VQFLHGREDNRMEIFIYGKVLEENYSQTTVSVIGIIAHSRNHVAG